MEAARYLDSVLSGVTGCDVERDAGLWAWLSLFYFEDLCPPDGRGRRKPGERARWIRLSMRHGVFIGIYSRVRIAFTEPTATIRRGRWYCSTCRSHERDDSWYQLASRQELVTNPAIMEAATELDLGQCGTKPKARSHQRESWWRLPVGGGP